MTGPDRGRIVLAAAVGLALATGTRMVDPGAHELACAEAGVSRDDWLAALARLRAEGLIQLATGEPGAVSLISLNNAGLLDHLRASRSDLPQVERRIAAAVVATAGQGPVDLAGAVGEPRLLVECLLDGWVAQRLVVYSNAPCRRFRIHRASLPGASPTAPETATGKPAATTAQA